MANFGIRHAQIEIARSWATPDRQINIARPHVIYRFVPTDRACISATHPSASFLRFDRDAFDQLVPPRLTARHAPTAIGGSMRLFMIPVTNPSDGGTGTASFEGLAALKA